VVDDFEPWHRFVSSLLHNAPLLKIVGQAFDGMEAVQKATELQPDVILLDIGLPALSGIEAALRIRKCAPKSQILFVSAHRGGDMVNAAMATGAMGYIVKSNANKELLPALQALRCGLSNDGIACEEIVDAAVDLMRSDYASMQMLFPERGTGGELQLLSFRGFNPQAARFWEWVRADSKSTCGFALRGNRRVVAPDIPTCDFMADSEDQKVYLETGIRACQTTPLITRSGNVVGMLSTHWRTPHQPSEDDFRIFDILAKQATDVIERRRREEERSLPTKIR
jgi:DNA-binding NarL/FixJ family response regulator